MRTEISSRKLGVAQILLSGVCFGFLGLFGKWAFAKDITPGELLSLRFFLGGFLLFGFYVLTDLRKLLLRRDQLLICAALGIFGYAVFSAFYFQALRGLSASLTVLLLYTYPVLVSLGGWLFLGETIPQGRRFALPLAFTGMIFLVGGDFEVMRAGSFLFGIGSAVFYAVYILLSRKWLREIDPVVAVAYIQFFAGAVLMMFFNRNPARIFEVIHIGWPILVGMALVCSLAAMALFQAGLKKLTGWEASLLSTAEPISGVFIATWVLNERLSLWQAGGAAAVLAALVAVSVPAGGICLESIRKSPKSRTQV